MIRITGGDAKGRTIKVYRGGQVRPTSDKVRQAIFNILEHRYELDFTEISALDLFAGSGSLGLEMLSRGGRSVTFVEADSKAASVLRANLKIIEELRDTSRVGRASIHSLCPHSINPALLSSCGFWRSLPAGRRPRGAARGGRRRRAPPCPPCVGGDAPCLRGLRSAVSSLFPSPPLPEESR